MSMINDPTVEALGRFLDVDVARYKLITSNLANIDTPGFRTRDLDFHAELARASSHAWAEENGAENGAGSGFGSSLGYASYTPVARHVRGLLQRPDGNDVNVERESLLLAEAQMKFNLGVALLKDQFHTISQAISSGGAAS
jgi:flagellar basal-body rod protein FlgB